MVGVPGRSKGCNTCIQRKVKCDGGQPACGNCRKSNRLCTGYKRPVAFVISSNVAYEPTNTEEPEGSCITTQGRWRKRTRRAPRALSPGSMYARRNGMTPEETAANTATTTKTTEAEAVMPAPKTKTAGQPGASAVLSNPSTTTMTMSDAEIRRRRKEFSVAPIKIAAMDEANQRIAPMPRALLTIDAVSRAVASLESKTTLLDFASDVADDAVVSTTTTTKVATTTNNNNNNITVEGLPVPMAWHVSSDAVWREQLFPVFLRFHLPSELMATCKGSQPSRNWLLNLPSVAISGSPVLETAMTALCMARIGRKHANPALIQHSLRLYTRGLRELQDAIHDPATQRSDQTLAASLAFSLYEVAECPARQVEGYSSHLEGGLALLQMRGPDAHTTALGHALFVFMRVQNFIYSLLLRKSCFLSRPEWIDRPWQTSSKDPHDKFMDQMYRIPLLLEQADVLDLAVKQHAVDRATLVQGYYGLVAQYQAIYTCLQGWFKDLQAIVAGPLYAPELSSLACPVFDDTERGRPFAVAFHFPAFSVGQSMVLYWLVVMVVNNQMAQLYRRIAALEAADGHDGPSSARPSPQRDVLSPLWPSSQAPSPAPSAGTTATTTTTTTSAASTASWVGTSTLAAAAEAEAVARAMGNNICQSIEYFLRDNMGDIGPLAMLLPLTTVRFCFAEMEPSRPCPPGPPGHPGEHCDEIMWVDFLIMTIGSKGHRLAYFMDVGNEEDVPEL